MWFGGVPFQISRNEHHYHHTRCSKTFSILILLIFSAYASQVLYSWFNSPNLAVSQTALLLPRDLDLITFGNEVLAYLTLEISYDHRNNQWCYSSSNFNVKISRIRTTVPSANCTTANHPAITCLEDFSVSPFVQAFTLQTCNLFNEQYAGASNLGILILRHRRNVTNIPTTLEILWKTAKIIDSLQGFEVREYMKAIRRSEISQYFRYFDIFVRKYVIRQYDTVGGIYYEEKTVYTADYVLGDFIYIRNQDFGAIYFRIFIYDDYFIKDIKPTTLLLLLSRLGGMASVLSLIVLLLRKYNRDNLKSTEPGIDLIELQSLMKEYSLRKETFQSQFSSVVPCANSMSISLAGGVIHNDHQEAIH